jgi:hypothetical protein
MDHVEAREKLGGRIARFSILHPVVPSVGCGKLRILRIKECAEQSLDVTAGYESYERIES